VSPAEVQWAIQQVRPSPGNGAPLSPPEPSPPMGYAPVYYPGTVDPAGAAIVTVGAGEERGGIDFALQLVPVARIEGVMLEPDGQAPRSAQVILARSGPQMLSSATYLRPTPDGKCSASGVMPGHYTLVAQATARVSGPAPASGRGAAPAGPSLWATMEIDVNGRDVSGLVVTLQPGVSVSGRLVFLGQAPPGDMQRVRVGLTPIPPALSLQNSSTQPAADGTFTIPGAAPGKYRFSAFAAGLTPAASPWTLKSAVVEGRDWTDDPIELRLGQNLSGVVVTFSDRRAELSGTVFDATGRPTPEFFIVAFSTERRFWTAGSRRVTYARPASDGSFTITTLPPGEYHLCAVTDVDDDTITDAAFLETLLGASTTLTLADGEKKRHDVRLASGGV